MPRFPLVWKRDDVLLLANGLIVLPKTPGVEGAPRADVLKPEVVDEGKKLVCPPKADVLGLAEPEKSDDWFPPPKVAPKFPEGFDPRAPPDAPPRLSVGGPEPGRP